MAHGAKIAGYRLHKERILFSGGQLIRTIKYPLTPLDKNSDESKKFLKEFEEAVINDDLKVRGNLNINDYLSDTLGEKKNYTLVDFWISCLKAGIIWQPSTAFLIHIVNKIYSKPVAWKIIKNAKLDIGRFFDKEKFSKNFILPNQIRNKKKEKNFKQDLIRSLKDEYKDPKEKIKDVETYLEKYIHPKAKELILKITNCFFSNGNLVTDSLKGGKTEYQNQLWKEAFGIKKGELLENFVFPNHLKDFKKISFFIIPELFYPNKNFDELIEIRRKWLIENGICLTEDEKVLNEEIRNLVGLSDNCNPLSNFLGVIFCNFLDKEIGKNEVLERFYQVFTIIEPSIIKLDLKDKIITSLEYILENARKLGMPKIMNFNLDRNPKNNEKKFYKGWADYRQNFGSKMQSWFTNYQKRDKQLDQELKKFKEIGLQQAKDYLWNEKFDEDAEKKKKDILELIDILKQFFTNEEKSIKNEENYLLFESLLSLIKRRLNFFYQAYIQEEGRETKVNNFEPFKGLYKKIYKPVAFYGDSARRTKEKFVYKTIPVLEDGIENIKKLSEYLRVSFSPKNTFEKAKKKNDTPERVYRKALQFFWNKYREGMLNSSEFKTKCEKILEENTDGKEWQELQKKENKGRYVYYKSPYTKGALREIKLKDQDSLNDEDYLEKLNTLYLDLVNNLLLYNKDKLLADEKLLLDWVELAKNVVGLLLRFNTQEEFKLPSLLLNNFEQVKRYVERFPKSHYPKNEYSFIIQSLIFSEIRGAATLYSKKDYIAKYSVQIVGSDSKFKLYYRPKDPGIILSKERKQLMQLHYFAVSLGENLEKNKAENFNAIALGKNSLSPVFITDEKSDKLFRLSSSPYQLQFLDKFLYKPKGWENVDITLSEWSFIVERRFKIYWDLNEKRPKLLPVTDKKETKKNKLYIAIPFNLKPNRTKQKEALLKKITKGEEKQEKDLSKLAYPILGVDVGEYGLAYCLVKFNYDKNTFKVKAVEIVKDKNGKPIYGFITDKNIANIKDKFGEIQQRAKQGAFDEKDTTVSRVRENAVGALRNKVHVIVASGSSVVYEDSISNFETGSGRTTKIYNSVKRADTEFESEADKTIHSHIWGEKTKWVGRNVSAYASSYTCISCLKSLYQIKKDDLNKIKIIRKDGRVVTMISPYGEIKGYLSEKEKYEVGYQFKTSDDGLKSFRKMVQDFARPPVGENSEVLNSFAKDLLKKNKIGEFKKRRGNSVIFVCPFCHFVADADIQASFMMAIRGYLRFSGIVPSQSENADSKKQSTGKASGESFLSKTQNMLEGIDITEIKNLLSLKL